MSILTTTVDEVVARATGESPDADALASAFRQAQSSNSSLASAFDAARGSAPSTMPPPTTDLQAIQRAAYHTGDAGAIQSALRSLPPPAPNPAPENDATGSLFSHLADVGKGIGRIAEHAFVPQIPTPSRIKSNLTDTLDTIHGALGLPAEAVRALPNPERLPGGSGEGGTFGEGIDKMQGSVGIPGTNIGIRKSTLANLGVSFVAFAPLLPVAGALGIPSAAVDLLFTGDALYSTKPYFEAWKRGQISGEDALKQSLKAALPQLGIMGLAHAHSAPEALRWLGTPAGERWLNEVHAKVGSEYGGSKPPPNQGNLFEDQGRLFSDVPEQAKSEPSGDVAEPRNLEEYHQQQIERLQTSGLSVVDLYHRYEVAAKSGDFANAEMLANSIRQRALDPIDITAQNAAKMVDELAWRLQLEGKDVPWARDPTAPAAPAPSTPLFRVGQAKPRTGLFDEVPQGEQPKMAVPDQTPGGETPLEDRQALSLQSPLPTGKKSAPLVDFAEPTPRTSELGPGEIYWHGDKAVFTGNTHELHGATFYEYKLLEGHRKGETIVSQEAPSSGTIGEGRVPFERQPLIDAQGNDFWAGHDVRLQDAIDAVQSKEVFLSDAQQASRSPETWKPFFEKYMQPQYADRQGAWLRTATGMDRPEAPLPPRNASESIAYPTAQARNAARNSSLGEQRGSYGEQFPDPTSDYFDQPPPSQIAETPLDTLRQQQDRARTLIETSPIGDLINPSNVAFDVPARRPQPGSANLRKDDTYVTTTVDQVRVAKADNPEWRAKLEAQKRSRGAELNRTQGFLSVRGGWIWQDVADWQQFLESDRTGEEMIDRLAAHGNGDTSTAVKQFMDVIQAHKDLADATAKLKAPETMTAADVAPHLRDVLHTVLQDAYGETDPVTQAAKMSTAAKYADAYEQTVAAMQGDNQLPNAARELVGLPARATIEAHGTATGQLARAGEAHLPAAGEGGGAASPGEAPATGQPPEEVTPPTGRTPTPQTPAGEASPAASPAVSESVADQPLTFAEMDAEAARQVASGNIVKRQLSPAEQAAGVLQDLQALIDNGAAEDPAAWARAVAIRAGNIGIDVEGLSTREIIAALERQRDAPPAAGSAPPTSVSDVSEAAPPVSDREGPPLGGSREADTLGLGKPAEADPFINNEPPATSAPPPAKGSLAGRLSAQPKPFDEAALALSEWGRKTEKLGRPEQDALFAKQRSEQAAKGARAYESAPAEQASAAARAATAGGYERPTFKPLDLTPEEHQSVLEEIKASPLFTHYGERLAAEEALHKLEAGVLPMPAEWEKLARLIGPTSVEISKNLARFAPRNWLNGIIETMGISRALLATADLSATLRQGITLAPGHPFAFADAFAKQLHALVSKEAAAAEQEKIQSHADYHLAEESRLANLNPESTDLNQREEAWQSRILQHIPVVGAVVRASERAFVTFTNKLRHDIFYDQLKAWRDEKVELTPKRLEDLSNYLNNATGRGSLGWLDAHAATINAAFFAPRFTASRFELIADLGKLSQDAHVRKLAAKDLGLFVATGVSMLTLLKQSGVAKVQLDPRSSDFGKYNIGGQRHDFWAGFGPIARLVAQEASGKVVKNGEHGNVTEHRDRTGAFLGYLRTKASPSLGLAIDVHQGKSLSGADVDLASFLHLDRDNPIIQRTVPLFFQDAIDAYKQNGLVGLAGASSGALGEGVQSYDQSAGSLAQATGIASKQSFKDAGYPQEATGLQSKYWIAKLKPVGGDPSGYDSFEAYRKAYVEKWTAVGVKSGKTTGDAKKTASDFFDKQPAVVQWKSDLKQSVIKWEKAHADLLTQAYDDGSLTDPDNLEKSLIAAYRKAH